MPGGESTVSSQQLLTLWSESTAVSGLIWVAILLLLLYAARQTAHEMILSLAAMLRRSMRLAARSVMRAEARLSLRNREVLLAMAEESQGRFIEHEFQRVHTVVSRDLSGYPALHRQLCDQITHIDEDYRQSTEVPPMPPAWVQAVEAVAKIPADGDPVVGEILRDIHRTVERASRQALDEYRNSSRKRHLWLKRMLPYWRNLTKILQDVNKTITGLDERSKSIDLQMQRYEQIRAGSDTMVRTLSSSSSAQFFISGLILVIAVFGAAINFELIARPMSEMVGGTREVMDGIRLSDVAAMVIILIEITIGIFLMESLRITRMLPVVGALDEKLRRRMIAFTLALLCFFASIEAGLAYMRDLLAAQDEALNQLLASGAGAEVEAPAFRWIPSVAQMVLGFILPFALTLVAIPLESFIHSGRTVFGRLGVVVLRVLAALLRLAGALFQGLGRTLVHVYDLLIFLPLALERALRRLRVPPEGTGPGGVLLSVAKRKGEKPQ